jgi:anti-sigma regulatory factor (Ser/Thr protein kinase)
MNLDRLTVPGRSEFLSQLMDYVVWASAAVGLDDAAAYRLSLAVDEIATNIVLHGYEDAGRSGELTVWAETSPAALTIYLEDTGKPFDPRQVPRPADLDRPLEERRDGGLGIYLALWGVDQFVYERAGQTNRCVFTMNRAGGAAEG